MHPILFRESFFFCARNDLEHLQPLSQSLLNMIVAGSNVLPLRPIYRVDMGRYDSEDKTHIFVEDPAAGGTPEPDYEGSILDGNFKETYLRLQNTCVKEFNIGIHDSPFLRYWKAEETAAFTVVGIDFHNIDDTDHDFVDSVMHHLRPKMTSAVHVEESFDENGYNDEYLKHLARDSFLLNLQTCRLCVWDNAFPPPSFILKAPGYRNYELECGCDGSQVADGIDAFIESFVRDGYTNGKLESVSIQWSDPKGQQSPAPKKLKKPTKTDVPLPENHLTAWLTPHVPRVFPCEMHSFVNAEHWQRMEIYKWTVEHDFWGRPRTTHILQCLATNL